MFQGSCQPLLDRQLFLWPRTNYYTHKFSQTQDNPFSETLYEVHSSSSSSCYRGKVNSTPSFGLDWSLTIWNNRGKTKPIITNCNRLQAWSKNIYFSQSECNSYQRTSLFNLFTFPYIYFLFVISHHNPIIFMQKQSSKKNNEL